MRFVGNLLYFIFGFGFLAFLIWLFLGVVFALTIIGIPFSYAAFRIASFAAFPFGKQLIDAELVGEQKSAWSGIGNFLWIIFAGLWLAIAHIFTGIGLCLTIIGIPIGLAHFKIAEACFAPLGKRVVSSETAEAARIAGANLYLQDKLTKPGHEEKSGENGAKQNHFSQNIQRSYSSSYLILLVLIPLGLLTIVGVIIAPFIFVGKTKWERSPDKPPVVIPITSPDTLYSFHAKYDKIFCQNTEISWEKFQEMLGNARQHSIPIKFSLEENCITLGFKDRIMDKIKGLDCTVVISGEKKESIVVKGTEKQEVVEKDSPETERREKRTVRNFSGNAVINKKVRKTKSTISSGNISIDKNVGKGTSNLSEGKITTGTETRTGQSRYLLAHYKFEEGRGTSVMDSSGNGNHGIIYGTTYTNGYSGGGLNFNGNSYVNLDRSKPIQGIRNSFTIAAWVYPTRNIEGNVYIHRAHYKDVQLFWSFGDWPAKFGWQMFDDGGANHTIVSNKRFEIDKWHHVAGTYDGSVQKLYVNGELVASANWSGNVNWDKNFLSEGIGGKSSDSGCRFYGIIDEVKIFGSALPQTEIQTEMR